MTTSDVIRAVTRELYDEPEDDGAVALTDALSDDALLEAARLGRLAARGGLPYDNPHPPGSSEYMWSCGSAGHTTTRRS